MKRPVLIYWLMSLLARLPWLYSALRRLYYASGTIAKQPKGRLTDVYPGLDIKDDEVIMSHLSARAKLIYFHLKIESKKQQQAD